MSEVKEIKKINVKSFVLIWSLLSATLGLIVGILMFLGSILTGDIVSGVGFLIVFPILYFIMGLIGGFIFISIYNFLAKRIGGVKITLK